jgi:Uma2 family endonuclease
MIATAPRIFPGIAFQMPNGGMTDEQFYQFCVLNHELRIERTADKYIVVMPPTNSDTGHRNFNLTVKFGIWNETTKLGKGFDSSTGFKLPNGAERAPDLAWIRNERWAQVNEVQRKRFAPICPDFVVEIRSGDQNMTALKQKMEEYMSCGCRLGWLVDPQHRETRVYFENGDIHTVPFADLLSGGDVLPGFSLRMADVWAD